MIMQLILVVAVDKAQNFYHPTFKKSMVRCSMISSFKYIDQETFLGYDISENQIKEAKTKNKIENISSSTEIATILDCLAQLCFGTISELTS